MLCIDSAQLFTTAAVKLGRQLRISPKPNSNRYTFRQSFRASICLLYLTSLNVTSSLSFVVERDQRDQMSSRTRGNCQPVLEQVGAEWEKCSNSNKCASTMPRHRSKLKLTYLSSKSESRKNFLFATSCNFDIKLLN